MKLEKLIVGLVVLAAVLAGKAEILYWQVTQENSENFTYAQLMTYDSAAGKSSATAIGTATAADIGSAGDYLGTYTDLNQTDVSAYKNSGSTQMFFIELYQYSAGTTSKLRDGYAWSYNDLQSSGYIATDTWGVNSAIAAASAANLGSATPEPTSGMLLLIGGSLLALRRRRRQA